MLVFKLDQIWLLLYVPPIQYQLLRDERTTANWTPFNLYDQLGQHGHSSLQFLELTHIHRGLQDLQTERHYTNLPNLKKLDASVTNSLFLFQHLYVNINHGNGKRASTIIIIVVVVVGLSSIFPCLHGLDVFPQSSSSTHYNGGETIHWEFLEQKKICMQIQKQHVSCTCSINLQKNTIESEVNRHLRGLNY